MAIVHVEVTQEDWDERKGEVNTCSHCVLHRAIARALNVKENDGPLIQYHSCFRHGDEADFPLHVIDKHMAMVRHGEFSPFTFIFEVPDKWVVREEVLS